jgi:uncharacterized oxidoreductase
MYMNAGLTLAFADDVLRALGAPAATAECVAEFLVNADKSGSNTHGVGLLPLYAKMIAAGSLDPLATPAMDKSAGSTIRVNGHNAFGQLTGSLAVRTGIEKVREHGVVAVAIRNGGHLGRLGDWARIAASSGMLFMAFCNSGGGARNVAVAGGHDRRLSTNPIAFGVPTFGALPFDIIADFATSQVSGSAIRECFLAGKPLRPDWATTADGRPLTDARAFMRGDGALLPLGGRETGHKGYALAVIAELLGGIAGGMMAGEHDPEWFSNSALFLLVDPLKFLSRKEISLRVRNLAAYLQDGGGRLPGEGAQQRKTSAEQDGLELDGHVCSALKRLADELQLAIPPALVEIASAEAGADGARTW